MRPCLALAAASAAWALAAAVLAPAPARACGGFFCNAQTQTPIIQAGERVLFARTESGVTMHIDVNYVGEPTSFGWLVPVPERPMDRQGRPVPLEQAVSLSASEIFQTLQSETGPTFSVRVGPTLGENCEDTSVGCGFATADSKATSANTIDQDDAADPLVLDEAAIGPYAAQLIEAPDVDTLFTWLGAHGYLQDPAARPLLQHYVDLHYVFVGLRLQSGKQTGDIRPVALHLSEAAPCVPLRLTKIAATDDMPILVWVMGAARAVPKNFASAIVNDMAITFPGGADYPQVVSAAVDTAAGHAWVTEMSGPTAALRGLFLGSWDEARFDRAETLADLAPTFSAVSTATARAIWRDELVPSAALAPVFAQTPEAALTDPATTLVNDLPTLKARLRAELLEPLAEVEDLLVDTTTLTRFFTTTDAREMTRDPVFAFNPDLPPVPREHVVLARRGSAKDCSFRGRVEYSHGRELDLGRDDAGIVSLGPVTGEPPLLFAEVLDESGPALRFHPDQAAEVDGLLDAATVGTPSLPASFVADPPAPLGHRKSSARAHDDDGCAGALPGAWIVLPVAALAVLRRRARARRA